MKSDFFLAIFLVLFAYVTPSLAIWQARRGIKQKKKIYWWSGANLRQTQADSAIYQAVIVLCFTWLIAVTACAPYWWKFIKYFSTL